MKFELLVVYKGKKDSLFEHDASEAAKNHGGIVATIPQGANYFVYKGTDPLQQIAFHFSDSGRVFDAEDEVRDVATCTGINLSQTIVQRISIV